MITNKPKCDNCYKEIERYDTPKEWVVMHLNSFYSLAKGREFIGTTRLDFCSEQCFLNYFINQLNSTKKENKND